jgi:hypothetical protein
MRLTLVTFSSFLHHAVVQLLSRITGDRQFRIVQDEAYTVVVTVASDALLTLYIHIKVQVNLQADKSSVVVKGPFFPQV